MCGSSLEVGFARASRICGLKTVLLIFFCRPSIIEFVNIGCRCDDASYGSLYYILSCGCGSGFCDWICICIR